MRLAVNGCPFLAPVRRRVPVIRSPSSVAVQVNSALAFLPLCLVVKVIRLPSMRPSRIARERPFLPAAMLTVPVSAFPWDFKSRLKATVRSTAFLLRAVASADHRPSIPAAYRLSAEARMEIASFISSPTRARRKSYSPCSEREPEGELHAPREVLLSNRRTAEIVGGQPGVRPLVDGGIERVEGFRTELEIDLLPNPEVLEHRHVHLRSPHVA